MGRPEKITSALLDGDPPTPVFPGTPHPPDSPSRTVRRPDARQHGARVLDLHVIRCGSAVVPPSGSQVREGLQRGACGMTALLIIWAVVGTLAIALLVWGAVQLWWLP